MQYTRSVCVLMVAIAHTVYIGILISVCSIFRLPGHPIVDYCAVEVLTVL